MKEVNGMIKVLYFDPFKEKPEVREIADTLEAKQELVGGLITQVYLDSGYAVICNDEGAINGMVLNRMIFPNGREERESWTGIFGPFFVFRDDWSSFDDKTDWLPDYVATRSESIRYALEILRKKKTG